VATANSHVRPLGSFVNALLEVIEYEITGPHRKGNDWHRGGFVSWTGENTRVTDIKVWYIVRLCPLVCH
jgi:hypothetical protein